MAGLGFWRSTCASLVFGVVASVVAPAQIVQLYEFTGLGFPTSALLQAFDGTLYGATEGMVYDLFAEPMLFYDGGANGLIQGTDGNFYLTSFGGSYDLGMVFALTPSGTMTTLYNFSGPDGALPVAEVIQASDGYLYGTTYLGGANNKGVVYKISTAGALTVLYSFCEKANCADGASPQAALTQGTDGNFYGTTEFGGTDDLGTVFKITSAGKLTVLHSFTGADGTYPYAGLVQATDGKFYGTTYYGGIYGGGEIYRITSDGKLTTLYSFCSEGLPYCSDGANPYAGVIQNSQGEFLGSTFNGGTTYKGLAGAGTIFAYSADSGYLDTEYTFCSAEGCADGANPAALQTETTGGAIFGTTLNGGVGNGTLFDLCCDSPFIETNPVSGQVGTPVTILGNGLTGTTKVTFAGKATGFTVVSDWQITTAVPTGATSGKVRVTTPSGKLSSNIPFHVTP